MRHLLFLFGSFLLLLPSLAHSQEGLALPTEAKVLHQHTVRRPDGGTTTFKRIEPPPVPAAVVPRAPTSAELADWQKRKIQKHVFISVSAEVHENGVTELWWQVSGSPLRALSNVDFELLRGTGRFEWRGVSYSMFLMMGAPEMRVHRWKRITAPPAEVLGEQRAAFHLTAGQEAGADAVLAMTALHEYFEANEARIRVEYTLAEAQRREAERLRKLLPPPGPTQTVVSFWPIQTQSPALKTETKASVGGAIKP